MLLRQAVTGDLSEYPQFVPLERGHDALLRAVFRAVQPEISEFSLAYQWIWRRYTNCRLCRFQGTLLLLTDAASGGESCFLPPVTSDSGRAAAIIRDILKRKDDDAALSFARVPETVAGEAGGMKGLAVTEEPGRNDYVYLAEDLRLLEGRRFRGKRNHVQQFWKAFPGAVYREMDDAAAAECAAFCRKWMETHANRELPGLKREVESTIAMLSEREWLGLRGGTLFAEGRVAAFALGEALNDETFVVRVEKADTSLPGTYQVINQEFARHAASGFKWVNREQDLGVPGLRRAKQSYCPHHLVRKYRVRPGSMNRAPTRTLL